jgi:hypothetical protein
MRYAAALQVVAVNDADDENPFLVLGDSAAARRERRRCALHPPAVPAQKSIASYALGMTSKEGMREKRESCQVFPGMWGPGRFLPAGPKLAAASCAGVCILKQPPKGACMQRAAACLPGARA